VVVVVSREISRWTGLDSVLVLVLSRFVGHSTSGGEFGSKQTGSTVWITARTSRSSPAAVKRLANESLCSYWYS
jgi:hypothetical protein